MAKRTKRRRSRVNLSRLRKSVSVAHRIYGYMVQAHDALRAYVVELDQRLTDVERGLKLATPRRKVPVL
jgi:vacuolar-type H+-ATPase subunit D/Vma8